MVDNIQHIIEHAEKKCLNDGSKLTPKRKRILLSLLNSNKAQSAYEIVESYQEQFGEKIPAMSAYRILAFLERKQLAHKLDITNKFVACSHITCKHPHNISQFLVCLKCQKVEEIYIKQSTMTDLKNNINNAGYHLVTSQIEINCICNGCYAINSQKSQHNATLQKENKH